MNKREKAQLLSEIIRISHFTPGKDTGANMKEKKVRYAFNEGESGNFLLVLLSDNYLEKVENEFYSNFHNLYHVFSTIFNMNDPQLIKEGMEYESFRRGLFCFHAQEKTFRKLMWMYAFIATITSCVVGLHNLSNPGTAIYHKLSWNWKMRHALQLNHDFLNRLSSLLHLSPGSEKGQLSHHLCILGCAILHGKIDFDKIH